MQCVSHDVRVDCRYVSRMHDAKAALAAVGYFQTVSSKHLRVGHSHEDIGAGLCLG